ncbi:MAG: hypothetical protein WBH50_02670, partial [Fuerstiella sp.]
GTNRELTERVAAGLFREDLFARINLWTFQLPGLAHRVEDIEPNLEFELERQSGGIGQKTSMTREARQEFLDWATSTSASWSANFRDLTAAVTRMATLAGDGRIGVEEVREEIQRLSESWGTDSGGIASKGLQQFLTEDQIAGIDLFDQAQLAAVLGVCRQEKTLAAAGRRLFAVSRRTRSSTNDSDRLRKYLARFELDWKTVCE